MADMQGKDPYLMYGFGLIAYRGTLFSLAIFFACMSILVAPMITSF